MAAAGRLDWDDRPATRTYGSRIGAERPLWVIFDWDREFCHPAHFRFPPKADLLDFNEYTP
jgi:hypothetical protein